MTVTSIYRAVVAEVERRRVEVGWTCLELDHAAGLSSGYWAKCVHPDEPSGRRIRWEMLEFVMGAVFPDGYKLSIEGSNGVMQDAASMRYHVKAAAPVGTPTFRARMKELGKKGAVARVEGQTPERRTEVARMAANVRWGKRRMDAEGSVIEADEGEAGLSDPNAT